jgi:hypothetical protein
MVTSASLASLSEPLTDSTGTRGFVGDGADAAF